MDKRLSLQLNGNRKVTGVLRGYDPFMNIVLDETVEEVSASEKKNIGMVVSCTLYLRLCLHDQKTLIIHICIQVIRGNSISIMEALERI